ncbi:MAG: hypothetical protein GX303_07215 [Clostridiales bacterium]|nr:hypothetical protein [Clostridiales bacterium]
MFNIFKRLAKKNNPNSKAYRYEMAKRLNGKPIRYVSERIDEVDHIIGRAGSLSVKDDCLLVFASSEVLFRAKIETLEAWELLSKEGVVLTAPDLENNGAVRTIIAYYVYYRK